MAKRRPKEEIIAEFEKKISYHKRKIEELELKIEKSKNPPPRKSSNMANKIFAIARENGMTIEEIAAKLNVDIPE